MEPIKQKEDKCMKGVKIKKYNWLRAKNTWIPSMKYITEAWWKNYWKGLEKIRNLKEERGGSQGSKV